MPDKNKVPSFSVIIPTLNEEQTLPNILNDLANQTFKDFELIIVDAKSEDKTLINAENFKQKFGSMQIITSDKRNVSYQRNIGAKKAKADRIIFLDADGRLPTYFLQGIKYHVEMKKPDILTTWIQPDSRDKKDKAVATVMNIVMDIQKKSKQPFLLEAFVCINKKLFFRLGGFDESLPWGEGSDFLKRANRRGAKFVYMREPKYTYSFRRIRKEGTLKALRNFGQIEFSRLMNLQISDKIARNLYPMEGGTYFEITENERGRLEKFFIKLISTTKNQFQNGKGHAIKHFFEKLFKD